jgi:hypothetical protein
LVNGDLSEVEIFGEEEFIAPVGAGDPVEWRGQRTGGNVEQSVTPDLVTAA